MAELKKIGFTPSLQTNASAPDLQKINDLQVRHVALIFYWQKIGQYLGALPIVVTLMKCVWPS